MSSSYRQHPIVLAGALIESLIVALLGLILAKPMDLPLLGAVVAVAGIALAIRRFLFWKIFRVHIKGKLISIRRLRGLTVEEQAETITAPESLQMRQNALGFLLDYGDLLLRIHNTPVQFLTIAPCSQLREQIDQL